MSRLPLYLTLHRQVLSEHDCRASIWCKLGMAQDGRNSSSVQWLALDCSSDHIHDTATNQPSKDDFSAGRRRDHDAGQIDMHAQIDEDGTYRAGRVERARYRDDGWGCGLWCWRSGAGRLPKIQSGFGFALGPFQVERTEWRARAGGYHCPFCSVPSSSHDCMEGCQILRSCT